MCLETNIELQVDSTDDDGGQRLTLDLNLGNGPRGLRAQLEAGPDGRVRVGRCDDGFGLPPEARDPLVLALYRRMARMLGRADQGNHVWARWVEPDLAPWVRRHLYEPAATRVVRVLSRHSTLARPRLARGFTESLYQ